MKYHKQINDYTCGSTALVNCFKECGIELTERYVRKLLGTNKSGTDEFSLLIIAEDYGFKTKEVNSKSIEVFKRKIVKDLKEGYKIILATDNYAHWIAVLNYDKRKIKIVDSRYADDLNKSIVQKQTVKQLADRCHNFNLETNKKDFYYIGLKLESE